MKMFSVNSLYFCLETIQIFGKLFRNHRKIVDIPTEKNTFLFFSGINFKFYWMFEKSGPEFTKITCPRRDSTHYT